MEFQDWYDYGVYVVAQMGRSDPARQELFVECKHREPAFRAVMAALTEEQRHAVEEYMVSQENLEYQDCRLAYELGKRVGMGIVTPRWMKE